MTKFIISELRYLRRVLHDSRLPNGHCNRLLVFEAEITVGQLVRTLRQEHKSAR